MVVHKCSLNACTQRRGRFFLRRGYFIKSALSHAVSVSPVSTAGILDICSLAGFLVNHERPSVDASNVNSTVVTGPFSREFFFSLRIVVAARPVCLTYRLPSWLSLLIWGTVTLPLNYRKLLRKSPGIGAGILMFST